MILSVLQPREYGTGRRRASREFRTMVPEQGAAHKPRPSGHRKRVFSLPAGQSYMRVTRTDGSVQLDLPGWWSGDPGRCRGSAVNQNYFI